MITRTLKENQGKVLAAKLEELLPRIVEEEKHKVAEDLLKRLQVSKPNPDQIWSHLCLTGEEDSLFELLCEMVWRNPKPKTTRDNS